MTIRFLVIFTALLFGSADANAHGGGLDSLGCHHNRNADRGEFIIVEPGDTIADLERAADLNKTVDDRVP